MDQALRDRLLRRGAELEMTDLRERMKMLEDLLGKGPRPGRQARKSSAPAQPAVAKDVTRPGRRPWTAAQRKAAAERMKARWALKNTAAGKKK